MPKMSPVNLARYNKLYVAAVTFAGALVSNQVITGRNADIVSAAIGAAGVLGVFAVPNAQTRQQKLEAVARTSYDPSANVDWTPTGQGAPAVHLPRRDASGRFSR
jgi:hypothetical protein